MDHTETAPNETSNLLQRQEIVRYGNNPVELLQPVAEPQPDVPSLLSNRIFQGCCHALGLYLDKPSWRYRHVATYAYLVGTVAYFVLNLWQFFPEDFSFTEGVNNVTTVGVTAGPLLFCALFLPQVLAARADLLRDSQRIYSKLSVYSLDTGVKNLIEQQSKFLLVSWLLVFAAQGCMFAPIASGMAQIPWVASLGVGVGVMQVINWLAAFVFGGWWALFNAITFEALVLHRVVLEAATKDILYVLPLLACILTETRNRTVADAVAASVTLDREQPLSGDVRQQAAAMNNRVLLTLELVIKSLARMCGLILVPYAICIGFHGVDLAVYTSVFFTSRLFQEPLFDIVQYWLGFMFDCISIVSKLGVAAWVSHKSSDLFVAATTFDRQVQRTNDPILKNLAEALLRCVKNDRPELRATICKVPITLRVVVAFCGTSCTAATAIAALLRRSSSG